MARSIDGTTPLTPTHAPLILAQLDPFCSGVTILGQTNATECNRMALLLNALVPLSQPGGDKFACSPGNVVGDFFMLGENGSCNLNALNSSFPAAWRTRTCGVLPGAKRSDTVYFDSNTQCNGILAKLNTFILNSTAPIAAPSNSFDCIYCTKGGDCEPPGGFCCNGSGRSSGCSTGNVCT